ncbi:hypothetical protein PsAD46_04876 [Pseudovibrio sp. Ad46]|nr:hypothetical protein PsAD46_04876 [Pseudovibrio sp. Ad46]
MTGLKTLMLLLIIWGRFDKKNACRKQVINECGSARNIDEAC